MENFKFFKVILFYITLIILCIFNTSSQQVVKVLGLNEGEICRKALKPDQDYVCTSTKHCKAFNESIRTRNYLDICTFVGLKSIVCCPTPMTADERSIEIPISKNGRSLSVDERCKKNFLSMKFEYLPVPMDHKPLKNQELLKLNDTHNLLKFRPVKFYPYVFGGIEAELREFPHMALLGYGVTTMNADDWRCGGSLLSERWILTAAHCLQSSGNSFILNLRNMARWARLGVLARVFNESNINRPKDYQIVEHVIHPDYKPPSLYNDIALFRLERDVEFSEEVRPICLNSDPSLTPAKQIVTGWGRISTAGPVSDTLLKVYLDIFPIKQCNESYFSNNNSKLEFGILPDSMICAGSFDGERDSCMGDSGGPLQVKHADIPEMYTQFGIISFGRFCGDKDTPGVYTKVAKYISWIEKIAFSNN